MPTIVSVQGVTTAQPVSMGSLNITVVGLSLIVHDTIFRSFNSMTDKLKQKSNYYRVKVLKDVSTASIYRVY